MLPRETPALGGDFGVLRVGASAVLLCGRVSVCNLFYACVCRDRCAAYLVRWFRASVLLFFGSFVLQFVPQDVVWSENFFVEELADVSHYRLPLPLPPSSPLKISPGQRHKVFTSARRSVVEPAG